MRSFVCAAPETVEIRLLALYRDIPINSRPSSNTVCRAGMADAKRCGVHTGRKHTLQPHRRTEAARLHHEEGRSLGTIAALFGCGRTVVYRAIQDTKQSAADHRLQPQAI
jgi:hypothetical protein